MERRPFTVATWNLWGGNAPGIYLRDRGEVRGALPGSVAASELDPSRTWLRRLPLLTAELRGSAADVIALQENTRHGDGATCATELADRLGMAHCEDDHERGLALLTRARIRSARTIQLGASPHGYPAPLVVELEGHPFIRTCVVLHLPLARTGDRTELAAELAAVFPSLETPLLVCGDLNATPGDPLVEALLAAGLVDASAAAGPTMAVPAPRDRIDYVLVAAGPRTFAVSTSRTLGRRADAYGFFPSDHLGVAVELT